MKANLFFVTVWQAATEFKLAIAELKEKYPFAIKVLPALSSDVACQQEVCAVCAETGVLVLKEMATYLRSYAVKEIVIPIEDCSASLDGQLVRVARFEFPSKGDDVQDMLVQTYGFINNYIPKKADIYVYAQDQKVSVLLLDKSHPNQAAWQQTISKAFAESDLCPVFKDAWLISV